MKREETKQGNEKDGMSRKGETHGNINRGGRTPFDFAFLSTCFAIGFWLLSFESISGKWISFELVFLEFEFRCF